jgi:hypothetical protein
MVDPLTDAHDWDERYRTSELTRKQQVSRGS